MLKGRATVLSTYFPAVLGCNTDLRQMQLCKLAQCTQVPICSHCHTFAPNGQPGRLMESLHDHRADKNSGSGKIHVFQTPVPGNRSRGQHAKIQLQLKTSEFSRKCKFAQKYSCMSMNEKITPDERRNYREQSFKHVTHPC